LNDLFKSNAIVLLEHIFISIFGSILHNYIQTFISDQRLREFKFVFIQKTESKSYFYFSISSETDGFRVKNSKLKLKLYISQFDKKNIQRSETNQKFKKSIIA
jgi:hypothetical protein